MKKLFLIIAALTTLNYCLSQTITRHINEPKDALVNRIIEANALIVGPTYEFRDFSSVIILYFSIQSNDSLLRKESTDAPLNVFSDLDRFENASTTTLFNVLYSEDDVNYTESVVDTIDTNSGCCPCHLPATVDSIFQDTAKRRNRIIVLRTNPIRYDCSFTSGYRALVYDDLLNKIRSGNILSEPKLIVEYDPFAKDKKKEILKRIKKK